MTINTKYSLNQPVWFMRNNAPYQSVVGRITYSVEDAPMEEDIAYGFRIPKPYTRSFGEFRWHGCSESEVFATKEELLNSL